MDRLTDAQLDDLIKWHERDGTKRGELTTKALRELKARRLADD